MTTTFAAPESAAASSAADGAQTSHQYVSFRVAGQLLGVPVRSVQEVLNPHSIARVPMSQPEIAGLLNLRGQIVTALDLRSRLGLPPLGADERPMNVVVRHGSESYSFLVDSVGDVIDVSPGAMTKVPRTLDGQWLEIVSGVFRLEDELLIVVDVESILGFG